MRIFPISDLHLERRRLDLIALPKEPFDLLACPGDLYEGHPERGLAALIHLGRVRLQKSTAQVLVTRLDPGMNDDYLAMTYELRRAGIRTEL